jgi:hypothetical protein
MMDIVQKNKKIEFWDYPISLQLKIIPWFLICEQHAPEMTQGILVVGMW